MAGGGTFGTSNPSSGGAGGLLGNMGSMLGTFLGGPMGGALMGLGGLFGGQAQLGRGMDFIEGLTNYNPMSVGGGPVGVNFVGGRGVMTQSPEVQALLQAMTGQALGGGFNDPAFGQINLADTFNQTQSLGRGGAGLLQGLGAGALMGAQDQSGLINSMNDSLRALSRPGQNEAALRLLDSQFGRLGGGDSSGLADERALQAQRFLTNDNDIAQRAIQLGLANQQQQRGFGMSALGQGFQQDFTRGQSRLQNAINLFGLRSGESDRQFQQLLQAGGAQNQFAQTGLTGLLGLLNAEASRIGATGLHAQAYGNLAGASGAGIEGFLGGLGGLFS